MTRGVAARLRSLHDALLDAYGPQGWWPLPSRAGRRGYDRRGYHPGSYRPPSDAGGRFEVAVGAVLTQNTAWGNVELAMARLAQAGVRSASDVLACPRERLAELLRPSGAYRQKARKLRSVAALFASQVSNRPPSRQQLLGLWGVGEETADAILLYAFHQPVFVVDAYTRRLLGRLGIVAGRLRYGEIQRRFHEALAPDHERYGELHALIVRHAKEHCRARPRCGGCPVAGCPSRA